MAAGPAVPRATAGPSAEEYDVKAAFLYNFAKFVDWPPSTFKTPDDGLAVCVLGENPFGDTLSQMLNGKTVQERALALKRLANAREVAACQVLFVSASESARLPAVLEQVGEHPILTIGDMPGFIDRGGMIGFSTDRERHIRFSINLKPADKAGLKISSQLLKLAKTVIGQGALTSP